MGRPRSTRELIHSWVPFGLNETKPHHFREMLRIAWENKRQPWRAWKILSKGVCDGCALGTTGLKDWTIDGTHLCLVRLNLLKLNTMGPLDLGRVGDARALESLGSKGLRNLGRIPRPLRRRKGEAGFTPVDWDELWRDVGERWGAFEPDSTGMFVTSRGVTNEVYYLAQKVMRWWGTNNVDNSARLCHSPSTSGLKTTVGVAATTCSYTDWYDADLIVFFGSNPANDQPVATKYLHEARRRGARVLGVNAYEEPGMRRYWIPSTVDSALFGTELTDRWFLVNVGGDLAFLNAVQKVLIAKGWHKPEFIEAATEGFEEFSAALEQQPMEQLLELCGLSYEEVVAFAEELQRADKAVFVWSMGITQHVHGADTVRAICNTGLLREYVGRPGTGLMPIRGHSGVQGGAEMGAYANVFPGGVPIDAGSAEHFGELWGFDLPTEPGVNTVDLLEAALRDELQGFYCIGGNFLETMPQPERMAEALAKIPLRIHSDIFMTTQMLVEPADTVYVLPTRTRYEQTGGGTETSTERRVIFSPEIPRNDLPETRSEWELLLDFAKAIAPERYEQVHFDTTAAIRADIERSVPSYAGIAGLNKRGDWIQWGGPHLCADRKFPTASGKAHFRTVTPPVDSAEAQERFPFKLATRRGKQFNSMVQKEVDQLTGAARDHLFFSDEDVARLGLRKDQRVRLTSAYGTFDGRVFPAKVTPGTLQGHWPEVNVLLPHDRVEPDGGVPDYNARVAVEALG